MKTKSLPNWLVLALLILLGTTVIGVLLSIAYSVTSKSRADIPSFESPYGKDQEVTTTLLKVELTEEESEAHKFFVAKVGDAMKAFKIPLTTIDVVVYEDKERPAILVQRFALPKFMSDVQPHVIKLKRHGLQLDDITLEHMAYHEVARIKNIPADTLPGLEAEESDREWRAQREVYKILGEEKYMVYWKNKRNYDRILRRAQSEEAYLFEIKVWLGIVKYQRRESENEQDSKKEK